MRKERSMAKKRILMICSVSGACAVLALVVTFHFWRDSAWACPAVQQEAGAGVELHVDIDNTTLRQNYPDSSVGDAGCDEHSQQACLSMPIEINCDDSASDSVPGFAQGFDIFDNDGSGMCGNFVRLVMHLPHVGSSNASLRFSYSGSDPASVTRDYITNQGGYKYTAADGRLRVWAKDGPTSRKKASLSSYGDYVAPDTDYLVSSFNFDSNLNVTLYIEAVDPASFGETETLTVTLTPGGGGQTSQDSITFEIFPSWLPNQP
jgi:hypothetical protein